MPAAAQASAVAGRLVIRTHTIDNVEMVLDPALLTVGACPWDGFDPATIEFCEARLCEWVVEPSNAYTSLTKIVAGIAILWSCRRHRDVLIILGIAGVLQGFLGFALHATGTFWGEALDVSGMFIISGLFLAFAFRRLFGWSDRSLVIGTIGVIALSVGSLLLVRPSGIYVFSLQIAVWVGLEIQLYRQSGVTTDYRFFKYLIATFAIAFAVWIADKTGAVCDPDNHVFSAHSLWHVLTSLALYWYYAYQAQFRSESPKR